MSVRVGRPAPDFKADGFHNGAFETYELSQFRGRWVLLMFYPGDFTFVCPTELVAVANHAADFAELNVEPLFISTDSKFVHKAWQEQELSKMTDGGIPFPMLTDAGGNIGEAYGVYDEIEGVDIRGRFLIDPEGILQAAEVLTPTVGRNVDEILRQACAFQYAQNSCEVIPAGWQPGGATLKPGAELVGQVWKQQVPAGR